MCMDEFLQAEFGKTVPRSTLYRHLKRAGATRLKLGIGREKSAAVEPGHSNGLWLSDLEDEPCVLVGNQAGRENRRVAGR